MRRRIGDPPFAAAIVIEDVMPATPSGVHPAKASVGERVEVSATVYRDGTSQLSVVARVRAGGPIERTLTLTPVGEDRWVAPLDVDETGVHELTVLAWTDRYGTWTRDLVKRADAGQRLDVEFLEGAAILGSLTGAAPEALRRTMRETIGTLRSTVCGDEVKLAAATKVALVEAVGALPDDADLTHAPTVNLLVERSRASFGAWYELFPRSFGGFEGVTKHIGRIAELGFDVLYLPPIHPIGTTARKGPNNSLRAGSDDPGSPWAIGGLTAEGVPGGHTALHPELGTLEDFGRLVGEARAHDIEIALDLAFQCSPDHPWVAEHPEWFHELPDGTIRTAENPPKTYEDIHPIEFWPVDDADRRALWDACLGVVEHWIDQGVTIFRVDNPHTKPFAFWAWLIDTVQDRHPEIIFLAEAFTTPTAMAKLAEIGFTQSYTYFTWRHSRAEIEEYVTELAHSELVEIMRPNFWPTTPDILAGVLRDGPRSAFLLRVTLAATLAGNYGIYSGYELCENRPASSDNTEYRDSEKYQLVERDWNAPESIGAYIGRLNRIRRAHSAFAHLRTIRFHDSDNPQLLTYTRRDPRSGDAVLVVVNLDPYEAQQGHLDLDLAELGAPADRSWKVRDELTGDTYTWEGNRPWVRLDPADHQVAHIFRPL